MSKPTISTCTIFEITRNNDCDGLVKLILEEVDINERNDAGLTSLHICATYNCFEACILLLQHAAVQIEIPDFENGWTALHRSLYFRHFKIALLLIKAGARLGDEFCCDWKTDIGIRRDQTRSIRNWHLWTQNVDQ